MTRRYYRIRALEDVRAFSRGRPALRHRQFRAVRRPAAADLDDRRLRRPAGRAGRAEHQGGPGAAAGATWSRTSTWPGRTHRPTAIRCRRRCTPRWSISPRWPAAGGSPSRSAAPGRSPVQQFTFRPGRGRAGRGAGHPRHAPADRSAAGSVAAEELHRHPDAGRAGHLPVPPGRARTTRPTSGSSRWPRSGTSRRCGTPTARSSASRSAERVLAACLESIRRVQAQRTSKQRLDNNRVFLHVWPPIEVPLSRPGRRSRR